MELGRAPGELLIGFAADENCTKVQAKTVLPLDVPVSFPSQDVGVQSRLRVGGSGWKIGR